MTYTQLINDVKFLLTGSSSGVTSYSLDDMTSNINRHYDRIVTLILRCDNRWEWDDDNYTTLPIATTDIIVNQLDYNIASATFLNLLRLELKDPSGNWTFLSPVSEADKKGVAMTEWQETPGTPLYYDKVGNSVILYPTPDYSSAGALKAYYQRIPSYFATTDTTKTPGFIPLFHRLLSYSAAYDYALLNLPNRAAMLEKEMVKMDNALLEHYSARGKDDKPRMKLYREDYGAVSTSDMLATDKAVDWRS
jgi:hypothetical protein